MKTAIIIHGMPDNEEYYDPNRPASSNCHWIPWLQKQFILKDVLTQTPEMPVAYNPEYKAWSSMLERFDLNEDTILVGHSCGGGLIVRYLSENNIKVGKVVLVAPWIDPGQFLTDKEYDFTLETGMFNFQIDPNMVNKTKGVAVFSSTNDMKEVQDSIDLLKESIKNIKVVEFENMGHFTHKSMQKDEFPELLEECLN